MKHRGEDGQVTGLMPLQVKKKLERGKEGFP